MRHRAVTIAFVLSCIGGILIENRASAQRPVARRLVQRAREVIEAQTREAQTREAQAGEPQTLPPPVPSPPVNPAESRPRIGVVVQEVSAEAIRRDQLVVRSGALITTIEPGSAADQAGLPIGGVIVSFNGVRIDSPDQLTSMVRSSHAGQSVEIGYYDGPRLFRKRLTLSPGATPSLNLPPPLPSLEPLPPPGANGSNPATLEIPLLDRLGRALGGIAAPLELELPNASSRSPQVEKPSELSQLRRQVELLEAQIQKLNERLTELESNTAE